MKLSEVDAGFDTVGNATLICYDQAPILVTDPWVVGSAYFGSWGLSHKMPDEQLEAIKHCEYVWISHGHPDHLNADSESYYFNKKILLPDHVGGRIYKAFKEAGLNVSILEDHKWYQLSDRIRVLCMADYNQDGVLLIDINGRLLVDMNDANWSHGWLKSIRKVVKQYDQSFLLRQIGHGDADMINIRNEDGDLVLSRSLIEKQPLDDRMLWLTELFGTKAFIPFSCLHRYQREDSVWANEHLIELDESPPPPQNSLQRP